MRWFLIILLNFFNLHVFAQKEYIVVDAKGGGNFVSIQAAINSIPDTALTTRTIFIKAGTYIEKIFITKHNILLLGEDKTTTIITQAIARDYFRCFNNSDWGVATVNVNANDITFKNITINNNYGFINTKDTTVVCGDSLKLIKRNSHQMAFRSFDNATRIAFINCNLIAYAGDTVSPWNVKEGMFYFKDCYMEGGVDFYCPRGWSFAENCKFYANTGSAAIWHDGSVNPDAKSVLVNCYFDGYNNFNLGRWHRDAQFFLINCTFSANMANTPIFLVKTNNVIQWGNRQYYYNCSRESGNYAWFSNNLESYSKQLRAKDITPSWTFNNQWNIQWATN
jgi:pectinesterase